MKVKIVKTVNGASKTLDIKSDANGNAYIEGKTPDESEPIIKAFIENDPSEENKKEQQDTKILMIPENQEITLDATTYDEVIVDGGILTLKNDINPKVTLKKGLLAYQGFTVNLSEQQSFNINNAEGGSVLFDECYFNNDIKIADITVKIDDGAYENFIFGKKRSIPVLDITDPSTLWINNGAALETVDVGAGDYCLVNSEDAERETYEPVRIGKLIMRGRGELNNCHVKHVSVERFGELDIFSDVDELDVYGTAYISIDATVKTIRLHAGGRIYGHVSKNSIIASERAIIVDTIEDMICVLG